MVTGMGLRIPSQLVLDLATYVPSFLSHPRAKDELPTTSPLPIDGEGRGGKMILVSSGY